jgi:hypothetical protein
LIDAVPYISCTDGGGGGGGGSGGGESFSDFGVDRDSDEDEDVSKRTWEGAEEYTIKCDNECGGTITIKRKDGIKINNK